MSRSHKRYPSYKDSDRGGSRIGKRFANKRVRRTEGVFNGGSYKKLYDSYAIVDWKNVDFDFDPKNPYVVVGGYEYGRRLEYAKVFSGHSIWEVFEDDFIYEDKYEWAWVTRMTRRPLPKRNDPNHKWWQNYCK